MNMEPRRKVKQKGGLKVEDVFRPGDGSGCGRNGMRGTHHLPLPHSLLWRRRIFHGHLPLHFIKTFTIYHRWESQCSLLALVTWDLSDVEINCIIISISFAFFIKILSLLISWVNLTDCNYLDVAHRWPNSWVTMLYMTKNVFNEQFNWTSLNFCLPM